MTNLQTAWSHLRREEGQTMAEYALVLALIVAVTAGVFTILGGEILAALQGVIAEFG